MPFVESLRLDGAARYSDYSQAGAVWSWNVRAEWAPTLDAKLRGAIARAVRAPNVIELFEPNAITLYGGSDPCAGATPQFTAAQCARTGVTAAEYGNVLQCPAAQCNELAGGNLALKPEDADTKTAGFVLTPTFLGNFTATIDYYDIKIDGLITNIPASDVLTGCATGTSPAFCALIHRTPQLGTIFGSVGYVGAQFVNTGFLQTDGVDVSASYRQATADFGFGDYGGLTFQLDGTWIDHYRQQNEPGQSVYDCAGLFGITCTGGNASAPLPRWRSRVRVGWDTPWNGLGLLFTWRHINSVGIDINTNQPILYGANGCTGPCGDLSEARIPNYDYLDISARIPLRPGIDFNFGVLNVFDKDPPVLDTSNVGTSAPPYGNGNTYPQTYDSLGRVFFANVTLKN
jgi:iron complex outermembrane recepter protein